MSDSTHDVYYPPRPDPEAAAAAQEAVANHSGVQVQDGPKDADTETAVAENAKGGDAAPGPTTALLATPMHAEPDDAVMAARMAPDPGRGGTRTILTTTPIIGPVEGNIAMPDTSTLIAYPWAQMGVGDSFEVGHGVTKDGLLEVAAQWASDTNPAVKFEAHQSSGGVRIWRVT